MDPLLWCDLLEVSRMKAFAQQRLKGIQTRTSVRAYHLRYPAEGSSS